MRFTAVQYDDVDQSCASFVKRTLTATVLRCDRGAPTLACPSIDLLTFSAYSVVLKPVKMAHHFPPCSHA